MHVHDTYFVVAHFHYIMVGGAIMGYLGGIHFWWPKITGRMYPEFWGRLSAGLVFVGFNLTFFPQFLLGYLGMPRRYHAYPEEFQVLNVLSTAGASVLGVGYLLPIVYLIWSLKGGPRAAANPWGATGLEWETPSPPPTENFHEPPVVTHEAYDYAHRGEAPSADGAPSSPTHGASGHRRPPLTPERRRATTVSRSSHPALAHHFDTPTAAGGLDARDVAVPGHRDHVLRRAVRRLRRLPLGLPGGVRRRQPPARHHARPDQHRRPDRQL